MTNKKNYSDFPFQPSTDRLSKTFERLYFTPMRYDNLTAEQMKRELQNAQKMNHDQYDAFICCILTHGRYEELAGIDGKYLQIREDILELYTAENCAYLRGKPKLFIIQACRGSEYQEVFETDIEKDAGGGEVTDTKKGTLPNEADFLLAYATVPGHVAFRSATEGSWYISTLVEAIDTHYKREDMMSILTDVNKKLSKKAHKFKGRERFTGQVGAPVTTLCKKLFFSK